jgi:YHS domain-containing protein
VTAILIWIVRLLVILLFIRLLMRALGVSRGPAIPRPRARDVERSGGTLVQDPQCGTYLPKSRALMIGSGDDTKYFCSPACRDAYAASAPPPLYRASVGEQASSHKSKP